MMGACRVQLRFADRSLGTRRYAKLLRPAPLEFDGVQRRLNRAASIADLRELARRKIPRSAFDFADGAAGEGELALERARDVFSRMEFHPSVLNDVSTVSTETMILGKPSAQPFVLAPTGLTRLMHAEGELAVVPAAQVGGHPVCAVDDGNRHHRGHRQRRATSAQMVSSLTRGGTDARRRIWWIAPRRPAMTR